MYGYSVSFYRSIIGAGYCRPDYLASSKTFRKKGVLTAVSVFAALILFGFIWNCCTSWNPHAHLSENLTTGTKRTIGKHYVFWKQLITPAGNQGTR